VTELEALQAALAAEQAVIYGYGVIGARTHGTTRARATHALAAHVLIRDRLIEVIRASGANPSAAQPAYQLPYAVTGTATARQLGAHLEQGAASAAWDLVAASPPGSATRATAINWLSQAAQRAAYWGGRQALPGQPA
jgi:Domain of unknown function (DUF4439)